MIIAIDGPAGAGKSTIAKLIARRLGFLYIDTGAMYRALTLKALRKKINVSDTGEIIKIAQESNIDLSGNEGEDCDLKVYLDQEDVTKEIRDIKVTKFVSDIAKIKEVREIMVGLQRRLGKKGNVVLDGRDIGTVVFPDAHKKFYLDADFKERVLRRHRELTEDGKALSLEDVGKDLKNRDTIDSTRTFAPLKKAEDAVYIDTTNLNIDQVIEKVLFYIKNG